LWPRRHSPEIQEVSFTNLTEDKEGRAASPVFFISDHYRLNLQKQSYFDFIDFRTARLSQDLRAKQPLLTSTTIRQSHSS
jgi:hypothetical protein